MGKSKDLATRVGIDDNADATAITINNSENVGIGTTSPSSKLTLKAANNGYTGGLRIEGVDETTALAITHVNGDNYFSGNATNDHLILSSSGHVTMPSQPMFDAYLTASSTHSSGVYNLSTGDSWATRANIGNHFSSGTFTAPVDGRYLFTANITANGSVGAMAYFGCEFQVNGNRRYIHWWGKGGSTGSYFAANNSAIISLAANDVVRLASEKAQSTTIVGGAGYTSFTGMLIG